MKSKKTQRQLFNKDCKPPAFDPLLGVGPAPRLKWYLPEMSGESYRCGFCGTSVSPSQGVYPTSEGGQQQAKLCICRNCSKPTFFDTDGRQYPEEAPGNSVSVSEESVRGIYEEARRAISTGAFTAAVLCFRKLLMHIAVERGASVGQTFQSYVQFLSKKNHIPPSCQSWIDQIRKTGNEANHQIVLSEREDAEQLLQFSEMLLKIFYEYPALAAARKRDGHAVAAK